MRQLQGPCLCHPRPTMSPGWDLGGIYRVWGHSMRPGGFPPLLPLTNVSKPALRAQRDPPSPRGGRAPRQSAPGRRAPAAFRRCPRGPGRGAAGGRQVVGRGGWAPRVPPSQTEQWAEDARRPLTPYLPREPHERNGPAKGDGELGHRKVVSVPSAAGGQGAASAPWSMFHAPRLRASAPRDMPGQAAGLRVSLGNARLRSRLPPSCRKGDRAGAWGAEGEKGGPPLGLEKKTPRSHAGSRAPRGAVGGHSVGGQAPTSHVTGKSRICLSL